MDEVITSGALDAINLHLMTIIDNQQMLLDCLVDITSLFWGFFILIFGVLLFKFITIFTGV